MRNRLTGAFVAIAMAAAVTLTLTAQAGRQGGGAAAPTLEIFNYSQLADGPAPAVNRPGFGHIAFAVDSVDDARAEVLAAGGKPVGDVVTLTTAVGSRVTWCYVTDPEGNIVELQHWTGVAA